MKRLDPKMRKIVNEMERSPKSAGAAFWDLIKSHWPYVLIGAIIGSIAGHFFINATH